MNLRSWSKIPFVLVCKRTVNINLWLQEIFLLWTLAYLKSFTLRKHDHYVSSHNCTLQITYHFQNNDHSHLWPPEKKSCFLGPPNYLSFSEQWPFTLVAFRKKSYIMDNRAGGTKGPIATQILLELDAKPVLPKDLLYRLAPSPPPDFQAFRQSWIVLKSRISDPSSQHSYQSHRYENLPFACKFGSFDTFPRLCQSGCNYRYKIYGNTI